MTTTTITNFRQNIFEYVKSAIEFNDVIDVSTKDGNAVMMSKEDYNAMLETLEIIGTPGMAEKLNESLAATKADLTPLEKVEW